MFVYKITNNINNKVYIGITQDIKNRFNYHKTRAFQPTHKEYEKPLYKSFRKYGLENFSFDIVYSNLTLEEAKGKEKELIKIYHSLTHENGYNIGAGGEYSCAFGEEHHNAILTENEARDIHQRRLRGEKRSDVYNLYKDKITANGFNNVWQLRTWKHIDPDFEKRERGIAGIKNGNSIFTKEQVIDIRLRRKNKEKRINVYKQYSSFCSEAAFNRIWYYYTYKDIVV